MTNEVKLTNPSDIHNLFKSIRRNMDFFKIPRYEAFLHSFRILEAMNNNVKLGIKSLDEFLLVEQSVQDTMKYLIYWIYTESPEGGRFTVTEDRHIEKTYPAIELARNYSMIHDSVVATQKGWMTLEIDKKQKLISFRYSDPAKGVLFALKFFNHLIWENKRITKLIKKNESYKAMLEALDQLSNSVRITKDNELKYNTNEFILKTMEESLRKSLEKGFILSDSWSIEAYSVKDFRLIWIQLAKLSQIHILAFNMSLQKFKNNKLGYNNSIFRINKNALIDYIKKYSGLNKEVIARVIKDLTYDPKIPYIDIIQQPLIEISKNEIYFSPNLIIGSLIDRNLQVLLTKLPYRQKEYDRLKNLKEEKMINDITVQLRINEFEYRPKIKLKENNRVITDIDILIWDRSHKNFLIIELKWFYGADSTQEVYNHDIQFYEGITKTKNTLEYLYNHFEKIESLIKIPSSKGSKNIYGVIVSIMGTPSPFIRDPNFPVIEEEDFYEYIKKSKGDVQKLYKIILSFFESKKRLPKFKESSQEVRVENFRFILPAIEY